MKNPFNFKKDIKQLKETGKKMEERFPLLASITKSVLVIIKWIIILFFICCIIAVIFVAINNYQENKRIKEKKEDCRISCSIPMGFSYAELTQEELDCYKDCLGSPSLKLPDLKFPNSLIK